MISQQIVEYLKLTHGLYNTLVMLLFIHQGWLGLKIRQGKGANIPKDFTVIKRHRDRGPALVLMGLMGYMAGNILVYVDKGQIIQFPAHFIIGSSVSFLLIATFFISRKIKGPGSLWRNIHYFTGLGIICLYLLQVFLGLNILL